MNTIRIINIMSSIIIISITIVCLQVCFLFSNLKHQDLNVISFNPTNMIISIETN